MNGEVLTRWVHAMRGEVRHWNQLDREGALDRDCGVTVIVTVVVIVVGVGVVNLAVQL